MTSLEPTHKEVCRLMLEEELRFFRALAEQAKTTELARHASNYAEVYTDSLNMLNSTGDWEEVNKDGEPEGLSLPELHDYRVNHSSSGYYAMEKFFTEKIAAADEVGEFPLYGMPYGTISMSAIATVGGPAKQAFITFIPHLELEVIRKFYDGVYSIQQLDVPKDTIEGT